MGIASKRFNKIYVKELKNYYLIMRKKNFKGICLGRLGGAKDFFQADFSITNDHLTLKEEYKTVKDEIISFIETKTENEEYITKGEIEQLPHYSELPCSLEYALTYDADIAETFKYYIWKHIQLGELDVWDGDSLEDIEGSEIGYLTYSEEE